MSDEPRSRNGQDGAEGPVDATREDAVRRLLADARETGPVPDDVVARLDAALADLAPAEAPTDLDSRRRAGRRWPTALLAAAAVVVVAGVGVGVVVDGTDDEGADSASAPADAPAEGPEREEAEREEAEDAPADDEPGITAESAPPGDATGGSGTSQQRDDGGPARLRSGPGLAADVGALLEDREGAPPRMEGFRACAPAYLAAEAVPALLDGARVDLVPTPASGAEVRVTVYPCDGGGTRTLLVPRG